MFKVGDHVRYMGNTSNHLKHGDRGEITDINPIACTCMVNFGLGVPIYCLESELVASNLYHTMLFPPTATTVSNTRDFKVVDIVNNSIPFVYQQQPSFWGIPQEEWTNHLRKLSQIVDKEPGCDCGGFKTYNTMSPESHSTWCKSRN